MAKRARPRVLAKSNGAAPKMPARSIFTNSAGQSFPIVGISPFMLDQIRIDLTERWRIAGHPLPSMPPAVPTYEAEIAGGGKEIYPLDAEGIETDEEKAKWAAYQLDLAIYKAVLTDFETECNTELSKEIFQSVDVDPAQDKEWIERCEYRKTLLPSNRFELRELYVKTWVVRAVSDIPHLMTSVLVTSELANEEAIKTVEDSFRRQLSAALGGVPNSPKPTVD
jgi:hypothetical protein